MPPVKIDASRTNRSLAAAAAGPAARPQLEANPMLLFYRRQIDSAVAGAKKTKYGIPTDTAIIDRWWIQELRPSESDKDEWERSFECACHWLDLEPEAERKKLLAEIDDALTEACVRHAGDVVYRRRAQVLSCAKGIPIAIGKQFVLALVSLDDYEQIALIEHPDPPARKKPRLARPSRSSKRLQLSI
jgi:hypothetical protein